jgi:hypothetical protein
MCGEARLSRGISVPQFVGLKAGLAEGAIDCVERKSDLVDFCFAIMPATYCQMPCDCSPWCCKERPLLDSC